MQQNTYLWEEFMEPGSAHQDALAAIEAVDVPMEPVSNLATLWYGQFQYARVTIEPQPASNPAAAIATMGRGWIFASSAPAVGRP